MLKKLDKFAAAVKFVLIFLFMGPPIGGMTLWTVIIGTELLSDQLEPEAGGLFYVSIIFSHPFGMLSALVTALLLALVRALSGKYPRLWHAILVAVALATYDVFTLSTLHLVGRPFISMPLFNVPAIPVFVVVLAVFAAYLLPTLICWRLARPRTSEKPPIVQAAT